MISRQLPTKQRKEILWKTFQNFVYGMQLFKSYAKQCNILLYECIIMDQIFF